MKNKRPEACGIGPSGSYSNSPRVSGERAAVVIMRQLVESINYRRTPSVSRACMGCGEENTVQPGT